MASGKVLVVATLHWPATTRLCLEMAGRGIDVHVLAPAHHALHRLDGVTATRLGRSPRRFALDLVDAVQRHSPDLVIPADDPAVAALLALEARCAASDDPDRRSVADRIAHSLGPAASRALGLHKSRFLDVARAEGLRVPATEPVPDPATLRGRLVGRELPVVLKLDAGHGGQAVRLVERPDEIEPAVESLRAWEAAHRLPAATADRSAVLSVQEFVPGRPANRAVFCWRGDVLAGISVEAVETMPANGPATVVRPVDCPDMRLAAERLVRCLGLSGFVGFDFIRRSPDDAACLLEMNARPTPICHWAPTPAGDLIGSLKEIACGHRGAPVTAQPLVGAAGTIALFPQEWWRDPASPHLGTATPDRPVHLDRFVAAYRRPVPEDPFLLARLRRRLRGRG